MAIKVFRRLALEHPVLYRIAFQRVAPALRAGPEVTAARQRAFAQLQGKIRRLERAGLLGRVSLHDATIAFEAMMEGLANAELRGRHVADSSCREGKAGLAPSAHHADSRVPSL